MRRFARRLEAAIAVVTALTMAAALVAVLVFHIGLTPVLSPSMSPAFAAGSLVITEPEPVSQLRTGQIVVFTPPGETSRYAHRIVAIDGATQPVIRTKGDANPLADPWHARLSTSTVPVVVGSVPALGRILVDARHGGGRPVLVALAGLLIMLVGRRLILLPARPSSRSEAVTAAPSPRRPVAHA